MKLESVDFHRAEVSVQLLRNLLDNLRNPNKEFCNLKHVRFGGSVHWWTKFEQIPDMLFAESLSSLVSVELPNNLKAEKITHLLTKIKNADSVCLKEINFGFTELGKIPAALLVDSLLKLEKVTIGSDRLFLGQPNITITTEQVGVLLSSIVKRDNSRLKYLKVICWEDETFVDPKLIAQADKKLSFLKVIEWNREDLPDDDDEADLDVEEEED